METDPAQNVVDEAAVTASGGPCFWDNVLGGSARGAQKNER